VTVPLSSVAENVYFRGFTSAAGVLCCILLSSEYISISCEYVKKKKKNALLMVQFSSIMKTLRHMYCFSWASTDVLLLFNIFMDIITL
jgi:hypothetical protein